MDVSTKWKRDYWDHMELWLHDVPLLLVGAMPQRAWTWRFTIPGLSTQTLHDRSSFPRPRVHISASSWTIGICSPLS
jgi:hypothetical protein